MVVFGADKINRMSAASEADSKGASSLEEAIDQLRQLDSEARRKFGPEPVHIQVGDNRLMREAAAKILTDFLDQLSLELSPGEDLVGEIKSRLRSSVQSRSPLFIRLPLAP
jgi:hypothetical protein